MNNLGPQLPLVNPHMVAIREHPQAVICSLFRVLFVSVSDWYLWYVIGAHLLEGCQIYRSSVQSNFEIEADGQYLIQGIEKLANYHTIFILQICRTSQLKPEADFHQVCAASAGTGHDHDHMRMHIHTGVD